MNISSGDSDSKRDTFFTARVRRFNAIVMENTVIDALRRSTRLQYGFPKERSAGDFGKKA